MCGRFTHLMTWRELHARMRLTTSAPEPELFRPNYNTAPTQQAPVMRRIDGTPSLSLLRWGLVPSWSKDLAFGSRCINARSEEAAT